MAAEALIRSIPSELPHPSMSDVLLGDHRETITLIRHFRKAAQAEDALLMEKLTDAIALTIRLHSQAEMDTLYPFMEKTLGKVESHVGECLKEHSKVEQEVMQALQLRKEGGTKLADALNKVFDDFEKHMFHEEDECVVALLDKASEADLLRLATEFMRAKESAPLDPQPMA